MQVKLNSAHIILWGRVLGLWLFYVGFCVVVGWSLHPRLDEVIFAVFLPGLVVGPYIIFCLLIAALRAALIGRHDRHLPIGFGLLPKKGVDTGAHGVNGRAPHKIASVGPGRM